jgi:hypothetical protein
MDIVSPGVIYSTFFFIDIVGLSDPIISTECHLYRAIDANDLLILPTGDGMAVSFPKQPILPLKFAIELHTNLNEYN